MRTAARAAVELAQPEFHRGGRNLIYILSQSRRFGHFGTETQILRTLHEENYDRIVIVTGPLDQPGTNPFIPACAGPRIRFVHTDRLDILLLGQVNFGLQPQPGFDLLLLSPRAIVAQFFRHIVDGGAIRSLDLAPEVAERARVALGRHGIDADEPFVFFHNRTLLFRPGMTYHRHRTAEVTSYRDSIALLIESGYRVIRLGEPGLDKMGFDPSDYVNVPDWPEREPAVDLFVCARCAFALAQNSGPVWVAAAFGRPALRSNIPFAHLDLPFNDDLLLFKHYHRIGEAQPLSYREILDVGLPALNEIGEIAGTGHEIVPNSPAELLAATAEMLSRTAGTWRENAPRQERFRALGREYARRLAADPTRAGQPESFYGYPDARGVISQTFLDANPHFLD